MIKASFYEWNFQRSTTTTSTVIRSRRAFIIKEGKSGAAAFRVSQVEATTNVKELAACSSRGERKASKQQPQQQQKTTTRAIGLQQKKVLAVVFPTRECTRLSSTCRCLVLQSRLDTEPNVSILVGETRATKEVKVTPSPRSQWFLYFNKFILFFHYCLVVISLHYIFIITR